jgi:uncharacterized cupin superfamily protein
MTRPVFRPGDDVGPLEDWPFDGPASAYVIERGDPRASGRLERGSNGSAHRLGVWRCTPGAFTCTERGDELQTILSGRLRLIRDDGSAETFGPGDSFFTIKGERVTWDIQETVTKVFFTYDRDGRDEA